jgi:tetratricopeptide (TPR) repeat protein
MLQLDSRGLTYLKMGQFDSAIEDYSSALRIEPKMASALYGHGLARLKKVTRLAAMQTSRQRSRLRPRSLTISRSTVFADDRRSTKNTALHDRTW